MKLQLRQKGGEGSGFYGHAGRPGQVGGSQVDNINAAMADELKTTLGGNIDVNYRHTPYEFSGETRYSNDIVITDNKTKEVVTLEFESTTPDKLFLKAISKNTGHGILGVRIVRAIKSISDKTGKPFELYGDNDYWGKFDFFDNIDEFRSGGTRFLKYTPIIRQKGSSESGDYGHAGRPGLVGGSASKPPTLPPELRRGNVGQVMERQKLRAQIMENKYGVKFSLVSSNPAGVAEGKRLGIPGIGLPRAIYDKTVEPVSDTAKIDIILEAANKWKSASGYNTFTTLKFATGLTFQDVMGVVKYLQALDPYKVSFSVDRSGKPTVVKISSDIVYKGGPGSGFHGHRGRPGLVGGSSDDDTPPPAEQFLNAPEAAIDTADKRRRDFEQAFPELYRILDGAVVLEADVQDITVQTHLKDLSNMPPFLLKKLREVGYKWYIGNKPVTELDSMQKLHGIIPRGWEGTGNSWDDVGGLCDIGDKVIILGRGRGGSVLALHETGHAIWSTYVRARKLNTYYKPLLLAYETIPKSKLPSYFQQPKGVGFTELFAEGFSDRYSHSSSAYMAQRFNTAWSTAFENAVWDMEHDSI